MRIDIIAELQAELSAGRRAVLVSVLAFHGSVPRKDFPRALFKEDGTQRGTVGGGCVDGLARQLAGRALASGEPVSEVQQLDGEDAESAGLICGGCLELEAEPFAPGPVADSKIAVLREDPSLRAPRLVVFGGGHVGLASGRFADAVGWRVIVHDDRASFVSAERFPFAEQRLSGEVETVELAEVLDSTDAILIATRGHHKDFAALSWAVNTKAGYLGLLGSKRKRGLLLDQLKENGLLFPDIETRLHSPVGLSIGALSAEEIALATVAELVAFRRNSR